MGARRLLAVVAVLLLTAGCSEEAPHDPTLDPEPVERDGAVGRVEDLYGVSVQVVDVTDFSQSPEAFPRLQVTMRSENTTLRRGNNPDVRLYCEEAKDGGDWYAGSTWEANRLLEPGVVDEGVIYVGFPGKEDNDRYPVPRCTSPRLVLTATQWSNRAKLIVSVAVSAETITKAIDRPRGPQLPLPPAAR